MSDAAIVLIHHYLAELHPATVNWLLDKTVSNSGRLKAKILDLADDISDLNCVVELVPDPDPVLRDIPVSENDIIITAEDFDTKRRTEFRLREVVADPTKWPVVTGGFPQEGFLAADGEEKIVINYDFSDLAYTGPRPTEIVNILNQTYSLVVIDFYGLSVVA